MGFFMDTAVLEPRLDHVEKVISIPEVEVLDLSRNGQIALFLSNHTGSHQLATLEVKGGPLRELTHGKERVAWARISNDSKTVAFSRDFGGKEEHQLFRIPISGGSEEQIAKLPPIRIYDFNWARRGDRIAFAGANKAVNGIWLLDAGNGEFSEFYKGKDWVFGPDWSQDDGEIVVAAKTTKVPTAFELVFIDSDGMGTPRIYTPKAGSENTHPQWHPKEPRVLFKTDSKGRYDLGVYDKLEDKLTYLKAGELGLGYDFPVFGWFPDGERVFYLGARAGRTRLYSERVDNSEPPVEIGIPEGWHAGILNSSVKIDSSGRFLVFSQSALSKPPSAARCELETQRITTLYEQPTELPLAKSEPVVYRSFDDRPIHGWFLRSPSGDEHKPCILWIHGGPAWLVADEWNPILQALALTGFNVFAPNIRGSSGYGVEFQNLNIHDVGGADLKDVEEAAKYLRRRPDVDPERIAIVGASYGGFMTFLATTKLPDLWAAGVAVVGITDWKEMYDLSDASFRSFIERYFGKPEENPDLYHDRSPINFAENLHAPLLILHRGNDSRCPLQPVEKFAKRLKELGKRYEMEVLWDAGHGHQKTENLVRQYGAAITFLSKELKAKPAVSR